MIEIKSTADKLPRKNKKPPIGRTESSVEGAITKAIVNGQMQSRIHSTKQSEPSFAATTKRSYDDLALPKALMTSIPFMYSTAVSFRIFVFSIALLKRSVMLTIIKEAEIIPTGSVAREARPILQSM